MFCNNIDYYASFCFYRSLDNSFVRFSLYDFSTIRTTNVQIFDNSALSKLILDVTLSNIILILSDDFLAIFYLLVTFSSFGTLKVHISKNSVAFLPSQPRKTLRKIQTLTVPFSSLLILIVQLKYILVLFLSL